ncbi:MAG: MogA/MoaB family molybdenum cofactor biosynthesis protein [Clostridia bacterium]|nr:MogA/MoaB family molybdenum cofactor biosynthesis protein [Clostridia bacterium]
MKYTAAIITISDKGARGEREDKSGPMLVQLAAEHDFDVTYASIIPDEREEIKAELRKCCDELRVSVVLTTGGTGFSPRDITPEATMDVVERLAPGISELMRMESMKITPRGCLSRSTAGIRNRTLIINLPGSPKAAKENVLAVIEPVKHGLDMLASEGSADCAAPVK